MAAVAVAFHTHPARRQGRIHLQAGHRQAEALELRAHAGAVLVQAHAGEHQGVLPQRGQVARHVERRAADHLAVAEVVHQRFAEHGDGSIYTLRHHSHT